MSWKTLQWRPNSFFFPWMGQAMSGLFIIPERMTWWEMPWSAMGFFCFILPVEISHEIPWPNLQLAKCSPPPNTGICGVFKNHYGDSIGRFMSIPSNSQAISRMSPSWAQWFGGVWVSHVWHVKEHPWFFLWISISGERFWNDLWFICWIRFSMKSSCTFCKAWYRAKWLVCQLEIVKEIGLPLMITGMVLGLVLPKIGIADVFHHCV